MILTSSFHTPVLLPQVIETLRIVAGKKYIDATLGGGGYTFEILKRGGIVLGIDKDIDAIEYVKEKLKDVSSKLKIDENLFLAQGNFADIKQIAHSNGFNQIAGVIFDLGMSSYQLEHSGRGFSYKHDQPLDMRMDKRGKLTAEDLLNNSSKEKLYEIFTKYAEELHSRTIAEAIVRARSLSGNITRTGTLTRLIDDVLARIYSGGGRYNKFKTWQTTKARIFQALRIAVNDELESLEKGLTQAIDLLETDGRIIVLSYHSLEDRYVKLIFRKEDRKGVIKIIKTDFIKADRRELLENPKARSAKLRSAEKL